MDYKKIYDNLITRAKSFSRKKFQGFYYEKHHIIPRSLGGTDSMENLVLLTAKEHFIAHMLLFSITIGLAKSKMASALWRMTHSKKYGKISAKQYSFIKENILISDETKRRMSASAKNKKNKRLLGTFKHSIESIQKMSTIKKNKHMPAWNKGLKMSEDFIFKCKQSHLGQLPWNKGLKNSISEETRSKMSDAKKGKVPWNKNKHHSEETKQKLRKINLERQEKIRKGKND